MRDARIMSQNHQNFLMQKRRRWIHWLYSSGVEGCSSECQLPYTPQSVPVPKQLDGLLQAFHMVVAEKPLLQKTERWSTHLRQGHGRAELAVAAMTGAKMGAKGM